MVKKHLQYKSLKTKIPRPCIRHDKKTDVWSSKVVWEEIEAITSLFDWVDIRVNRKQLDAFSRLIQYLWHDKIDYYLKKADPERRKQIRKDAKEIDKWLANAYKNIKKYEGEDT